VYAAQMQVIRRYQALVGSTRVPAAQILIRQQPASE
jgi:hypothetical protein